MLFSILTKLTVLATLATATSQSERPFPALASASQDLLLMPPSLTVDNTAEAAELMSMASSISGSYTITSASSGKSITEVSSPYPSRSAPPPAFPPSSPHLSGAVL